MFFKSLNILAATLACSSLCQPALSLPTVEKRDNTDTPRNVLYVQTFTDSNNNFYNLTDLVSQSTGITHVILASLHLDSPTELNLNDNDITSDYWDPLWPMVSSLQSAGVKVMLMMGGAAAGSWANLASDVSIPGFRFVTKLHQSTKLHTDFFSIFIVQLLLPPNLERHPGPQSGRL